LISRSSSEGPHPQPSTMLSRRARPGLTLKKSEERGRSRSVGRDGDDGHKEPASAGVKSTREENAASFFGDIIISQKKGADDPMRKSKQKILLLK